MVASVAALVAAFVAIEQDMSKSVGKCTVVITCTYNMASSEPVPLLFAVKSTQKTLHHLPDH